MTAEPRMIEALDALTEDQLHELADLLDGAIRTGTCAAARGRTVSAALLMDDDGMCISISLNADR